MTVDTGGPIRGFLGRWLMRFEASAKIFQITFLAITAASTLTSALSDLGYSEYAPYVLAAGTALSPAFAWLYVEKGLFNRKNRERNDRGDNFAAPGAYIGSMIQTQAFASALEAAENGENATEAAAETVQEQWQEYRDGVDLSQLESEQ
ncbi:MAG: hypothetical protein ABEI52_01175 [Halobacteriaceae archaeon]